MISMTALHIANVARGKEWENSNEKCDIDFWGVELAGEVGERRRRDLRARRPVSGERCCERLVQR